MSYQPRGRNINHLKELLHYDPISGSFTWVKQQGNRIKVGQRAGSVSRSGYRVIGIGGKLYKEHRLAWYYVTGSLPCGHIDHINGNRSDNRICNLRDATHSQNMQNQTTAHSNNKTGFLGVGFDHGKYRARININKTQIFLGNFDSPEAASSAYQDAKQSMHSFCTK